MTVDELIQHLRHFDQTMVVGVMTECCGCSGDDLWIEEDDDTLWIVDKHRRVAPPVTTPDTDDIGPPGTPPPPPTLPR